MQAGHVQCMYTCIYSKLATTLAFVYLLYQYFSVTNITLTLVITFSPSDIVLVDSAVILSCSGTLNTTIDDPSLLSIMWYHEEMMVQLTSNVSLSDDGTAFTNTLTINPFTISSVGDYRCVAMINDHDTRAEVATTVKGKRKLIFKLVHFEHI